MKQRFFYLIPIYFLFSVCSCVEPYKLPGGISDESILVVDAFLNATESICTVKLTRSQNLTSEDPVAKESNAIIKLVDKDGVIYQLSETEAGTYKGFGIPSQQGKEYYLHIRTVTNEEYESEKIIVQGGSEIDSLRWETSIDGIKILVNTHGTAEQSIYYRWDYDETWEYNSPYESTVEYVAGGSIRLREDNITRCWKAQPSTEIQIATAAKLSDNIIKNFAVIFIPKYTPKYMIHYSVLLRQHSVSEKEYEYWSLMKKNTQSLGTLFDPLPSRVKGNFHGSGNTSKTVLGFFSANKVFEKRLFLSLSELPIDYWYRQDNGCIQDTLKDITLDTNDKKFINGPLLLTHPFYKGLALLGFGYSSVPCVDCRKQGGTTTKPDYWPY